MRLPTERETLVRVEATTNSDYGKLPKDRSMEELLDYGLVVLNKQKGPTSHQVTDYLKQVLHIDKAGHSGTLDPNVTGVLVIALGKATRVVDVLLKSGKEYVCVLYLHEDVPEEKVRETLSSFIGDMEQLPPKKSAVKRRLRTRTIYYLDILEIKGRQVLFRVGCQAGTYIRKLCTDVSEKMGVKGHMQELVRTKVAHFNDKQWVTLHDLKDAYEEWKEGNEKHLKEIILPMEEAVEHIPKVFLADQAIDTVCHGAFLSVPGIVKLESGIEQDDTVAMMSLKGELIGIGKAKMNSQNMHLQDKGIAIADTRIFMERKTYPKYKKDIE